MLFENANNPGDPQVQAILKQLPQCTAASVTGRASESVRRRGRRPEPRNEVSSCRPRASPGGSRRPRSSASARAARSPDSPSCPEPAADLTSPASMPIRLMALEQSARPRRRTTPRCARPSSTSPTTTSGWPRARPRPRWRRSSGSTTASTASTTAQSCAAFASLTLELGAQVVGQQSWVTGGTLLPVAAAQVGRRPRRPQSGLARHHLGPPGRAGAQRWHPLGDGYQPQPGDWVLFDGHVEVVTKYAGGVLSHDRRRLAAELLGQRPPVQRSARRPGRSGLREQRRPARTPRHGSRQRRAAGAAAGPARYGAGARRATAGALAASPGPAAIPGRPRPARRIPGTVAAPAQPAPARPGRGRLAGPASRGSQLPGRSGTAPGAGATGTPPTGAKPRQPASPPAGHGRGRARGAASTGRRWLARATMRGRGRHPRAADEAHRLPGTPQPSRPRYRRHRPSPSTAAGPAHQRSAGVHQRGRARGHGHAAPVRRPGRGDDRSGHRRIRLGAEHASHQ